MEFLRLEDEVLSSPVFMLTKPGQPPVVLIGEIHIGEQAYFKALADRLDPQPGRFAGCEMVQPPDPDFVGDEQYQRNLANLLESIRQMQEMARILGLTTRRDATVIPGAVGTDLSFTDVVKNMSEAWADALAARVPRIADLLAMDDEQEKRATVRQLVAMFYRGLLYINTPEGRQELAQGDEERNLHTFSFLRDAAQRGEEARQIVGAAHLSPLIDMLRSDGYALSTKVEWLRCVDLSHL